MPADGEYVIRLSAEAIRRISRYKDEDLRYNSAEPMRLSISIDSSALGGTAHRIIGEYVIPDSEVVQIEHRVWLEKGFYLSCALGKRSQWIVPNASFARFCPSSTRTPCTPFAIRLRCTWVRDLSFRSCRSKSKGPSTIIWPVAGFARFFPDPPNRPGIDYLDQSLLRLADVAYRRPVHQDEVEPYLQLARNHYQQKGDFWEAAKLGVRAILTSPNFLYLAEPQSADAGHSGVSDHELATRLSYFLWSSMPDDDLRGSADRGELSDPEVLRNQVERMLSHPRATAFVNNFAGQWLGLRKLGEMPPDPETNRAYYEDNLEDAMREETRRFFRYLLEQNRRLSEFIDADYTFLNAALARHYGIPGVAGDHFRKVVVGKASHRGGLLGHASVLTATSNGVESQPVVRGVWILENLLGTPPNPPPPDIEPLEPDTRGVSTIRQLMEKHRK